MSDGRRRNASFPIAVPAELRDYIADITISSTGVIEIEWKQRVMIHGFRVDGRETLPRIIISERRVAIEAGPIDGGDWP